MKIRIFICLCIAIIVNALVICSCGSSSSGTMTSTTSYTNTMTFTSTNTGTDTGTSTGTATSTGTGTITTGAYTVTCYPTSETFASGTVDAATSSKADNPIHMRNNTASSDLRGWAKINLALVPNTATIRTVTFAYYVEEIRNLPPDGSRLLYKNLNPVTATGAQIYQIYDGTMITEADLMFDSTGWHYFDFPAECICLVQGQLNKDYIMLLLAYC